MPKLSMTEHTVNPPLHCRRGFVTPKKWPGPFTNILPNDQFGG